MLTNMIIAAILTFVLSAAFGPLILPWLRRLKFGQSILEIGPSWHKNKQGTQTVGGIIFIVPIIIITIILGFKSIFSSDLRALYSIIFVLLCNKEELVMSRVYNFSAGPAVLPEEVLQEAAAQEV